VAIAITVMPPWWETVWFRGALVAVSLGAIVGGVRWRIYAIEGRNRPWEKPVAERTSELTEPTAELQSFRIWKVEI